MRILDRYIMREMSGPLLFGVGAFTGIFIGTDLLQLARYVVELGAPVDKVIQLFLLRLPQIAVWTFPMAVLLSTLLSLSKLSSGSEIVAMKAGGVSIYRIAAPVIVIGALVTGFTFVIDEKVVPAANEEYNRILREEVRQSELPRITKNVILKRYDRGSIDWFLYAATFDGEQRVMQDVTMVELSRGKPSKTTYAERLVWEQDNWYMEKGITYIYGESGNVVSFEFLGGKQPVEVGRTPSEITRVQKEPDEMTIAELKNQIEILKSQGQETNRHEVQLYLKYSLPVASLVFAFVGAPLGFQSHRSSTSVGFGLSIVVIFAYYVLMTVGTALGQAGLIAPNLGAWLQNILLLLFGGVLFMRAAK